MTEYHKLRILWIDDREGDNPRYQYPEPELPKEYEPYFTIIRHSKGGLSSVRSPQEFSELFGPFWAGRDRSTFPAEIIAMDYVLSKWSPEEILARRDKETEDAQFSRIDDANRSAASRTEAAKSEDGGLVVVGFEGLLIGVLYASLTCDYPAGLVPMTYYGDQMEKVQEVRALHAMSKPLLDIDYSHFGISGKDREARSWQKVLSQGLKSLRYRITSLFIARRIVLSLADIVAMKDKPEDAVLALRSRYGTRRLPVAGLFADVTSEDRKQLIIDWAEELLSETGNEDPFEAITEARTIAEQHWSRYLKESDTIRARWKLSALVAKKKENRTLEGTESKELKAYLKRFGVKNAKARIPITKSAQIISICDVSADGLITRWACVFVLARLIAHLMQAQSKLNDKSNAVPDSCFSHFGWRDWLYALMPSPESPLILPAHHKGKNNPAISGGTLYSKLVELKSTHRPPSKKRRPGNCGFDCEHVFAGKVNDGSDLGLRPVERRLLEAAVMDHLAEADQAGEELEEFRPKLPLSVRTVLQGVRA